MTGTGADNFAEYNVCILHLRCCSINVIASVSIAPSGSQWGLCWRRNQVRWRLANWRVLELGLNPANLRQRIQQRTWFRRQHNPHWLADQATLTDAMTLIEQHLK